MWGSDDRSQLDSQLDLDNPKKNNHKPAKPPVLSRHDIRKCTYMEASNFPSVHLLRLLYAPRTL